MAFHRRKLLDPASYCKPYCDAAPKLNGFCPSACVDVCPEDTCNQSPPPPPPPPPPLPTSTTVLNKSPPLSLLLIASLSVLVTAFLIFTCYTIYKFYTVWRKSRRRRPPQPRRPEEEDDSVDEEDYGPTVDHPIWYIRTVGLQPSVINAITIVKYKKSDGLVDGTDCAVCLSEFQEDETVRLLPKCSHAFHIPCIDTWLASHTNCPMCRAGIVSNAAADDSGRAEEAQPEAPAEARIEIEECKMDDVQPVRRSASLDSISASMISAAVGNALSENNKELAKGKEFDVGRISVGVNRPSMERGIQIGSSSIKRSASCSAKVFLSRHCSRNGR